nr:MAG TPA: hypothetical protein [Caudoviricetes sp.]DAU48829.1 MAG TPA: hypothetical protein [Caudoviricetes sp.]
MTEATLNVGESLKLSRRDFAPHCKDSNKF